MTIQGNDERMIAYLLGELTEAEIIFIEEQYMADDEALAQLMAVEAELYDAYASHSLSPERTRRFENKFLATSEQQSRLEFSRALLRQPRSGPTRTPKLLAWVAAIFVVLILASVLTWKYWPVPQNSTVTRQAAVSPSRVVVPFTIGGGSTRSVSEESVLLLSDTVDDVRITIELERASHPPFQARLSTPEGTEVWKSDPARPIELLDDVHVKLDIPASGLANGHYILTLSAMNPNGDFEEIQAYSFLVRIQVPSK